MGRIEKGFEAAAGSFVAEACYHPAWGQSPRLGWPRAANEVSCSVALISLPLQLAHLKVGVRDEFLRREGVQLHTVSPWSGPASGPAAFKPVTVRQWELIPGGSDRTATSLGW